jgi:hypothetical protein
VAVDPETYDRFLVAEQMAKKMGISLVEALDRRGLLLTTARKHQIEVRVAEDISRRLDRQSPNRLMAHYVQRADGTAAEMFEAAKIWFDAVVRNLANGTLEDL